MTGSGGSADDTWSAATGGLFLRELSRPARPGRALLSPTTARATPPTELFPRQPHLFGRQGASERLWGQSAAIDVGVQQLNAIQVCSCGVVVLDDTVNVAHMPPSSWPGTRHARR